MNMKKDNYLDQMVEGLKNNQEPAKVKSFVTEVRDILSKKSELDSIIPSPSKNDLEDKTIGNEELKKIRRIIKP